MTSYQLVRLKADGAVDGVVATVQIPEDQAAWFEKEVAVGLAQPLPPVPLMDGGRYEVGAGTLVEEPETVAVVERRNNTGDVPLGRVPARNDVPADGEMWVGCFADDNNPNNGRTFTVDEVSARYGTIYVREYHGKPVVAEDGPPAR